MIIYCDIDETICYYEKERDYNKAKPILKNIHKTQIREGFELTQTEDFIYIPTDIINYIGEFTV